MKRREHTHGPVQWTTGRYFMLTPGLHLLHSGPGGAPVLRERAGWRTVSGVIVATERGTLWLHFRRWSA